MFWTGFKTSFRYYKYLNLLNRQQKNVDFIRIDGSTSPHHRFIFSVPILTFRHDLVQNFQTDPSCKVALLSITAAGVGLTLTAARYFCAMLLFTSKFGDIHWVVLEPRGTQINMYNWCISNSDKLKIECIELDKWTVWTLGIWLPETQLMKRCGN